MRGIQINNYFNNHITLGGKKVAPEQPITERPPPKHLHNPTFELSTPPSTQNLQRPSPKPRTAIFPRKRKPAQLSISKSSCPSDAPPQQNAIKTHSTQKNKKTSSRRNPAGTKMWLLFSPRESQGRPVPKMALEKGANQPSSRLATLTPGKFSAGRSQRK